MIKQSSLHTKENYYGKFKILNYKDYMYQSLLQHIYSIYYEQQTDFLYFIANTFIVQRYKSICFRIEVNKN